MADEIIMADKRQAAQFLKVTKAFLGQIDDLTAENDALRDEIADRANVEADLRAQLAEAKAGRT